MVVGGAVVVVVSAIVVVVAPAVVVVVPPAMVVVVSPGSIVIVVVVSPAIVVVVAPLAHSGRMQPRESVLVVNAPPTSLHLALNSLKSTGGHTSIVACGVVGNAGPVG